MTRGLGLLLLFAAVPLASAQRGGGSGHGFVGHPSGGHFFTGSVIGPGGFRGRRHFGSAVSPYWGFGYWGDYGDYMPPLYQQPQYTPLAPSPAPEPTVTPEPQPVAQSVIHEYNFDEQSSTNTSNSDARFTIAFKNGSSTSARAAWVQDGSLHFVDEEDRQQVVAPELIDRPATLRANREKNLYLQLPPG